MPDVIVMDVSMPGLNGLEATRQIMKANPATRMLVLTFTIPTKSSANVLDAGARGFLLNPTLAVNWWLRSMRCSGTRHISPRR